MTRCRPPDRSLALDVQAVTEPSQRLVDGAKFVTIERIEGGVDAVAGLRHVQPPHAGGKDGVRRCIDQIVYDVCALVDGVTLIDFSKPLARSTAMSSLDVHEFR